MKCIQAKKGRYLVLVNNFFGCYTDAEGNYLRAVDNINDEVVWAKEKWESAEEIDFPTEAEEVLMKQLPYIQGYKDSLNAA